MCILTTAGKRGVRITPTPDLLNGESTDCIGLIFFTPSIVKFAFVKFVKQKKGKN